MAEDVGHASVSFEEGDWDQLVQLSCCPGCKGLLLSGRWFEQYGDEAEWQSEAFLLWPSGGPELPEATPIQISSSFHEARRCMSIGCTAAAAVMARRVLEGIVNEQQAKGRTLHAKLADLHTRKMVSDDLLAWSLAIKDIGNEAAHGISTTTPADARDALGFAEALASYIYGYRARFAEFQRRRPTSSEPRS